jgi:hypothetical protein
MFKISAEFEKQKAEVCQSSVTISLQLSNFMGHEELLVA